MIATFLKITKDINSTKRPTAGEITAGTTFDIELIESTDILNPDIRILRDPVQLSPADYNYVYIPVFERYYYISTWTYHARGWVCTCVVDVLASWKTEIGALSLYVTRSASQYDTDVMDTLYPVKTSCTVDEVPLTNPWTYSVSGGCFVIGVISKTAQYGSVQYTAMSYSTFATLCSALLDDSILHDFSIDDASLALQKSVVNPIQYIVSAVFLPIPYASITGTTSTTLDVWDWTLTGIANTKITLNPYSDNSMNVTLPKHPATASRGNYCNASPYTRAELYFPPFGSIELDTSITATHPYIYIRYSVDYISGVGTVKVYARETSASAEQSLLANVSAQVGVPVQISQVTRNYLGGISSIFGSIASIFTGDFMGAGSGVGSAISSFTPHQTSVGTNGSFYQLQYAPAVYMNFADATADDNAHYGRPLMGVRTLNTLAGFIQVQKAEIEITGCLYDECEQIKNHLESGFYYE